MSSAVAHRHTRSQFQRAISALGGSMLLTGFAALAVVLAMVVRAHVWGELAPVLLPVPWLVAGALAFRARPGHPGAVLFLGLGVGHLTSFALSEPISLDHSLNGWGPWAVETLATMLYLGGFAALGAFLATYPSGVPATSSVRWFVRVSFGLAATVAVLGQLTSSPIALVSQGGRPSMPPPPGLPLVTSAVPVVLVGPLTVLVGAALLIGRGRRAVGDERRQLSWAVCAAGLLALMFASTPAIERLSPGLQTGSFLVVVSVIPFVLLAGLVRYRLMDVDIYVARTLARGLVVVLVLSLFALVAALAESTGQVVAAALAVVAALSGVPLVRRLEQLMDRWLSGGRVRGQALIRQLSEELAAPSRLEQARRTAETVRVSMDASWVRLHAEEIELVAGTPTTGSPDLVVALLAGEAKVGRLECGPRHGGWGAIEVAEVSLLARHAGLALHNSQLTGRLERQVVELAASRRRIVRAELGARKELERDLHDGVQQQVVAMIAHLGALTILLPSGTRASEVARTTLDQARSTLVELRQLVNGVQPPVLLDQGLVAAVRSRSALLPFPVQVNHDGHTRRWGPDTEAAAYYVISEALTNVVKHACATQAEVCLAEVDGALLVSVRDDGIGIPSGVSGSGIAGLRDRVEALDGTLSVSARGPGTLVTARLQAGEADHG